MSERTVIFSFGHKGGPGKSMAILGLTMIARKLGVPIAAFDFDGSTGTLLSYLGEQADGKFLLDGDPVKSCRALELTDPAEALELMNLTDKQYQVIAIDFPGATQKTLESSEALRELDIVEYYLEAGYTPVFLTPFTPFIDSIRGVKAALDNFSEHATVVAVRNAFYGDDGPWSMWDGDEKVPESQTKGRIEEVGYLIEMPKLYYNVLAKIATTCVRDETFTLSHDLKGEIFAPSDSYLWKKWLLRYETELRRVPELNNMLNGGLRNVSKSKLESTSA